MNLIVFAAPDLEKSNALFRTLLGTDPYVDGPYYVGFRTGAIEIGLDPNGKSAGPIAYWDVDDIPGHAGPIGRRRGGEGAGPTRGRWRDAGGAGPRRRRQHDRAEEISLAPRG
jgi:catechol 2,3-dioxygenase-like lactoylglutathione lyase family enzyme